MLKSSKDSYPLLKTDREANATPSDDIKASIFHFCPVLRNSNQKWGLALGVSRNSHSDEHIAGLYPLTEGI